MAFAKHTVLCLAGLAAHRRFWAIIRRTLRNTNREKSEPGNRAWQRGDSHPLFFAHKMS